MRECFIAALVIMVCAAVISAQENNDFYDNTETFELRGPDIVAEGEVSNHLVSVNIHGHEFQGPDCMGNFPAAVIS